MSGDYIFSFTVEGFEPFTREIPFRDHATAISFARSAAIHQVAVNKAARAMVLVAAAVSPNGVPLGAWVCTDNMEPVWTEATAEG